MNVAVITGYSILLLIAVSFWYLVEVAMFFAFLKKVDHMRWEALGSPAILSNNSISNSSKFLKALLLNEFKDSPAYGDLRSKLIRMRILLFLGLFLVISLFFATAFS